VSQERRSLQESYKDLAASLDSLIELIEKQPDPFDKPMWRVKLWSNYQMMFQVVEQLIEYHERYKDTPTKTGE